MKLLLLLKARKAYYKDKSGRVFRWDEGRKRYIYVRKGRHAHIKPEEIKRRERIKKESVHDRLRYERRTRSKFVGRVADGPAYEAIDQPYEKIKVGRAHSTQLPEYQYVSKSLREPLKRHQEDFINLAMQKFDEGQKGMSCFDGTGSGKSVQELALAETFVEHDPSARVVIVTESDRIISESLAKDGKMLGVGMTLVKKETDEVKDSGIYVTRYSDLASLKDKLAWSDLVIFDESHNMKNKTSSKTKAGIDLIESSKHSAMFTATPIDRPMHIEYLCKMYGLDFSKVMKFVGFQRLQYGWNTNQSAVVIAERLDSIFQALSEKGLFVRREVPLEGLDVTMKTVDMSASHKYWYESTVEKLREEVAKASDKDRGLTKARWLMRARAVLEEAKIKEALTSIDDAIKRGRQVVLFATRVNETTLRREEAPSLKKSPQRKLTRYQVAEIRFALQHGAKGKDLAEQYNINFRTISDIKVGKTWKHIIPQEAATSADRVKFTSGTLRTLQKELTKRGISFASVFGSSRHAVNDIKKFQKGEVKVMLTTADSGGTGLSLDDKVGDKPRTTVMMTPPFSAMSYVQMLGRIHRIDTKSDSEVVMINTDTMVDQWNKGIIANKLTALGGVVKGDYEKMDLHDLEVTETLSPEDAAEYMSKRKARGSIPYSSSIKFDFDAHKKGLKKSLARLIEMKKLLKVV